MCLDTLRVKAEEEKLVLPLVAGTEFKLVRNLRKAPPGKSTPYGHSVPVLEHSGGLSLNMPRPLTTAAYLVFSRLISFSSVRSGCMREDKGRAESAKGARQKVTPAVDRGLY